MKNLIYIFLLCITFSNLQAQSVSVGYSPNSVVFWGKTPNSSKLDISLEYKNFTLTYSIIDITNNKYIDVGEGFVNIGSDLKGLTLGYLYNILESKRISPVAGVGVSYFNMRFPRYIGSRINFNLYVGLEIKIYKSISAGYLFNHFSNGFGIFNKWNVGMDSNIIFTKINL